MDANEGRHVTLYDTAEVESKLERMAGAVASFVRAGRECVLVGVRRRGVPLAQALASRLAARLGTAPLPVVELAIKRYADDLTLIHPETQLTEDAAVRGVAFAGRCVILVDDVLYQGHSLSRAVEYLRAKGAEEVRTAVLVDRNVARLPVRADVVGMTLEVAPSDVIECCVPPYEPELQVVLWLRSGR
jgi:pyrimidine operon attenuation protein/uracil phosphoribosyltransferase